MSTENEWKLSSFHVKTDIQISTFKKRRSHQTPAPQQRARCSHLLHEASKNASAQGQWYQRWVPRSIRSSASPFPQQPSIPLHPSTTSSSTASLNHILHILHPAANIFPPNPTCPVHPPHLPRATATPIPGISRASAAGPRRSLTPRPTDPRATGPTPWEPRSRQQWHLVGVSGMPWLVCLPLKRSMEQEWSMEIMESSEETWKDGFTMIRISTCWGLIPPKTLQFSEMIRSKKRTGKHSAWPTYHILLQRQPMHPSRWGRVTPHNHLVVVASVAALRNGLAPLGAGSEMLWKATRRSGKTSSVITVL